MSCRAFSHLALAGALALGCSDSGPAGPDRAAVAGSYATRVPVAEGDPALGSIIFTTMEDGVVTDQVLRGAEIDLILAADGHTSGRLFVPDAGEDGESDFEADLAGIWTLDGAAVMLSHPADTFLRDMPLIVRGDRLEGDHTFDGVRVRVVLERQ